MPLPLRFCCPRSSRPHTFFRFEILYLSQDWEHLTRVAVSGSSMISIESTHMWATAATIETEIATARQYLNAHKCRITELTLELRNSCFCYDVVRLSGNFFLIKTKFNLELTHILSGRRERASEGDKTLISAGRKLHADKTISHRTRQPVPCPYPAFTLDLPSLCFLISWELVALSTMRQSLLLQHQKNLKVWASLSLYFPLLLLLRVVSSPFVYSLLGFLSRTHRPQLSRILEFCPQPANTDLTIT